MPLFPAQNSPTLVQRLSDRRRGLALVGLAAAALLGARAARRKGAGPAPAYTPPMAAAPAARLDAPPPTPVVPAPVGTIEPEPPAVPSAPAEADAPAEPEAQAAEPEAPAEPNTEELAAAEIAVLAILSQEGRLETDRTALGVATTLEREAAEVAVLLRTLHRQGHVAGDEYTATGEKIWFVTEAGTGRLD